jgi:hypothetical protein
MAQNFSAPRGSCGYYTNSLGHAVPRPCGDWHHQAPPSDATARCGDAPTAIVSIPSHAVHVLTTAVSSASGDSKRISSNECGGTSAQVQNVRVGWDPIVGGPLRFAQAPPGRGARLALKAHCHAAVDDWVRVLSETVFPHGDKDHCPRVLVRRPCLVTLTPRVFDKNHLRRPDLTTFTITGLDLERSV